MIRFFLLFLLASVTAHATDMNAAKQKANDLIGSVGGFVPNSSVDLQQSVPAYETSSPQETGYIDSNMYDEAREKAVTDSASQLIGTSHDTRPEFEMDRNTNPIFTKSEDIINNPNAVIDSLTGRYGACEQEGGEALMQTQTHTCDEFQEVSEASCAVGQLVEVDADHKYQCQRQREYETKTCNKTLSLSCISQGSCSTGGIVLESIATDMAFNYSNNILTIGTIADNYWRGYCKLFERTTTFTLNNVSKIQTFKLKRVGFDDFIQVILNGHTVYMGPYGGTNLSVINNSYVSIGHTTVGCELATNWVRNVDIDLKPYVVDGLNSLTIKVEVAGAGEGWVQIEAKQSCCSRWVESWSNGCGEYE